MKLFHFQTRHPETEEPIDVEAEYWPPRRGSRDAEGMLQEPDEPAEVFIRTVWGWSGVVPHRGCEEELVIQGLRIVSGWRRRGC